MDTAGKNPTAQLPMSAAAAKLSRPARIGIPHFLSAITIRSAYEAVSTELLTLVSVQICQRG
jgi:hypothetical protein